MLDYVVQRQEESQLAGTAPSEAELPTSRITTIKYPGKPLKMKVNIGIDPYTHSIYFFLVIIILSACHMDIWLLPANGIYVLPAIITLEQENWNFERILLISLF